MITEILGFFIILGAILVLVVKQISKRQQATLNDVNDMRESTEQLKLELQRSADAVINRIGGHIAHLEKLLQEADERNLELMRQLRVADETENRLRRYANEIEQQMLSWRQNLVTAPNMTNTNAALRAYAESGSAPERLDAVDFASVLQQSIARDEQPKQVDSLTALKSPTTGCWPNHSKVKCSSVPSTATKKNPHRFDFFRNVLVNGTIKIASIY